MRGQTERADGTGAVVLAAGASARLGRPKALLDFGGRPAILRLLDALAAGGVREADTVVVLGHDAAAIRAVLPPACPTVLNPDPARGRTSSLQVGLAALSPGFPGFLLAPVDVPLVGREVVAALVAAPTDRIVRPVHGGRRGHPIRVPMDLSAAIRALGPDDPLRDLLRDGGERLMDLPVADPAILLDIDTEEDHARALAFFHGTAVD